MRRALVPAAVLALALASGAVQAGDAAVQVGHNRLEPADVSVAVGDKVVFTNQDAMPGGHTVAADDGHFQSPPLEAGQSWAFEATEAGVYTYRIKEHPGAQGTIRVEAATSTEAD